MCQSSVVRWHYNLCGVNIAPYYNMFFSLQVAQENMDVFKDAWERNVRLLTEAVDDITTIDDFLAVSG